MPQRADPGDQEVHRAAHLHTAPDRGRAQVDWSAVGVTGRGELGDIAPASPQA